MKKLPWKARIVKTPIAFCLACPHRTKQYDVCYEVDPPRDIVDNTYRGFPDWCPLEEVDEMDVADDAEATQPQSQNHKAGPIITNTTFSPQIAADLKAKRVRAFVSVSAAERIWMESQSMDDNSDTHSK